MNITEHIDNLLNRITMYRLVVYSLILLLASGVFFSIIGRLSISTLAIIESSAVILIVGFIAEKLLPVIWDISSNKESSLITGLILCLIMPPTTLIHYLALSGLVSLLAIVSKYILAIHHKQLFNPAAIAVVIFGILQLTAASWWIGSPVLLPLTLILGLLIVRKIRRFKLFLTFVVAALIVAIIVGLMHNLTVGYILSTAIKSSPLVFLGTIMLTEPSTTPPRYWQQMIYGIIVGAFFTSQLRVGSVSATPEISLIIGNIYAFIVSPKYKLKLKLVSRKILSSNIYEFRFAGADKMDFQPGQYLEWTLPQNETDGRGNRRTFSIASAPKDNLMSIVIRATTTSPSAYKKTLLQLKKGNNIIAGQLAGDFILPSNVDQKLVFIAGGIGITPYLSMVKDMINNKQSRDIELIYLVSNIDDICYEQLWDKAKSLGVKLTPIITNNAPISWKGLTGRLDKTSLVKIVPDYKDRRFYISGPNALVDSYTILLKKLGVHRMQIVTDHFSGY